MGNSIEETIKQLKLILKVRKEQKEIIECAGGSCMNCNPDIQALTKSIDILSDYKRVLKENEEQKACIHILDNELKEINEKRKKQEIKIQELQKENEELKESKITYEKVRDIQEKNRNIVDNKYISKQKVKGKIEKEIKYHEKNILDIENITMLKSKTAKEEAEIEFNKYTIVVLKKMLQELLEGRK